MKTILKFIRSNVHLIVGFIVALIIFVSYDLTMDWPEIIPNGDFYYNFLSQLSLAYMGSFIFYIIQVYIPAERSKKITNSILKIKLDYIMLRMIEPAMCIMNSVFKKNLDIESMDKHKFAELYAEDVMNQGTKIIFRDKLEITNKEYAIENIEEINDYINDIYGAININLDIKIISILEKIKESKYNKIFIRESKLEPGSHKNFKKINGSTTTVIMQEEEYDIGENRKKAIEEYYELYLELRNYKKTLI